VTENFVRERIGIRNIA